jgi:hypothetical protein
MGGAVDPDQVLANWDLKVQLDWAITAIKVTFLAKTHHNIKIWLP